VKKKRENLANVYEMMMMIDGSSVHFSVINVYENIFHAIKNKTVLNLSIIMSITTNACFPFGRVLTSKSSIHGGCSMGMIIVLFEAIQKVIFVRGKMYN